MDTLITILLALSAPIMIVIWGLAVTLWEHLGGPKMRSQERPVSQDPGGM